MVKKLLLGFATPTPLSQHSDYHIYIYIGGGLCIGTPSTKLLKMYSFLGLRGAERGVCHLTKNT